MSSEAPEANRLFGVDEHEKEFIESHATLMINFLLTKKTR